MATRVGPHSERFFSCAAEILACPHFLNTGIISLMRTLAHVPHNTWNTISPPSFPSCLTAVRLTSGPGHLDLGGLLAAPGLLSQNHLHFPLAEPEQEDSAGLPHPAAGKPCRSHKKAGALTLIFRKHLVRCGQWTKGDRDRLVKEQRLKR